MRSKARAPRNRTLNSYGASQTTKTKQEGISEPILVKARFSSNESLGDRTDIASEPLCFCATVLID